jgi:ABC-2 type transport system permease protein
LLLVAASQMLRAELKTVWFLQCRPQSLAKSIEAKAHAWGGIAIVVTLITLVGVMVWQPAGATAVLRRTPFMLAALWFTAESMFGLLSLGATIVSEQSIKFRKSALILPGILTAASSAAIHSGNYWDQFVLVVVMGVFNTAIRQKQEFELRWLGEPSETPPVRLYALHGLTAILAFLFVRDVLKPLLAAAKWTDAEIIVGAYSAAAACVGLVSWLWVRRRGLLQVVDGSQSSPWRPVAVGLAATCLVGFAWDSMIRATVGYAAGAIGPSWHADAQGSVRGGLLVIFLVVLVAPIFEEWIFRGLLYRSLRQSSGVVASIAAASLLFTVIHPLSSCVPILTLAVATAWVYERTGGRLAASIAVHTGYNLFIVLLWNLRG